MIGVGNHMYIINEHLENMTRTKERIRALIPLLKKIIAETAVNRNSFDDSDDGKLLKKLKRNVASHSPLLSVSEASATDNSATIVIAIAVDVTPATAAYANTNADDTNTETDEINVRTLDEFRNREFVEKLSKARKMLTDQQLKLKTMRTSKVKDQQSIETMIFKVLKEIGVELSSYHGGSLNGKDIRKVMTNACYIFDTFAMIFKAGKRPNCMLSDANINALCMQFREVFVLWDGTFSLARTVNPTEIDCSTYRMYARAAVKGSKDLRCTVTPKVHLMLEHIEWQMTNIWGGVGDKMEDWVERLHQDGKRKRLNPIARAHAREKAHSRNMHPDVISQTNKINEGNKRNLAESKTDLVGTLRKKQRDFGRYEAMKYFMQDDVKRLSWSARYLTIGRWTQMMEQLRTAEYSCHRRSICDVRKFGVCKVAIRVT
jgi:hypothetical protein